MSDLSATQCGCNNGNNGLLDLILLMSVLGGNGGCGFSGFSGLNFGGENSCELLTTLLLINCLCGNR